MRADRLLSILMLLQNQGRLTAEVLATELEVSVRTIYRDMDALSAAGVPVYCERGPGGGCSLLDDYRTHLTGLTKDELQALFAMSVPGPLAELGVAQPLKAALRKLQASLPASTNTNRANQRILIDWKGWKDTIEQVPYLRTCHEAVWNNRMLAIGSRTWVRDQIIEGVVEPYALAAKGGGWYLIANYDQHRRVFRLSRLVSARITAETFERPPDFDLDHFWEQWCTKQEAFRNAYWTRVRIAPSLAPLLPSIIGAQAEQGLAEAGKPDAHGWHVLDLSFDSFEAARSHLLGFGAAVEILAPRALKLSVIDFAAQITRFYQTEASQR